MYIYYVSGPFLCLQLKYGLAHEDLLQKDFWKCWGCSGHCRCSQCRRKLDADGAWSTNSVLVHPKTLEMYMQQGLMVAADGSTTQTGSASARSMGDASTGYRPGGGGAPGTPNSLGGASLEGGGHGAEPLPRLNGPLLILGPNTRAKPYVPSRVGNATSAYRGVSAQGSRFRARACFDKREVTLGDFGSALEAALAYDLACVQRGKVKNLNFIYGGVNEEMLKPARQALLSSIQVGGSGATPPQQATPRSLATEAEDVWMTDTTGVRTSPHASVLAAATVQTPAPGPRRGRPPKNAAATSAAAAAATASKSSRRTPKPKQESDFVYEGEAEQAVPFSATFGVRTARSTPEAAQSTQGDGGAEAEDAFGSGGGGVIGPGGRRFDDTCFVCGAGGELCTCDDCPRVYHLPCIQLQQAPPADLPWHCPVCAGNEDAFVQTPVGRTRRSPTAATVGAAGGGHGKGSLWTHPAASGSAAGGAGGAGGSVDPAALVAEWMEEHPDEAARKGLGREPGSLRRHPQHSLATRAAGGGGGGRKGHRESHWGAGEGEGVHATGKRRSGRQAVNKAARTWGDDSFDYSWGAYESGADDSSMGVGAEEDAGATDEADATASPVVKRPRLVSGAGRRARRGASSFVAGRARSSVPFNQRLDSLALDPNAALRTAGEAGDDAATDWEGAEGEGGGDTGDGAGVGVYGHSRGDSPSAASITAAEAAAESLMSLTDPGSADHIFAGGAVETNGAARTAASGAEPVAPQRPLRAPHGFSDIRPTTGSGTTEGRTSRADPSYLVLRGDSAQPPSAYPPLSSAASSNASELITTAAMRDFLKWHTGRAGENSKVQGLGTASKAQAHPLMSPKPSEEDSKTEGTRPISAHLPQAPPFPKGEDEDSGDVQHHHNGSGRTDESTAASSPGAGSSSGSSAGFNIDDIDLNSFAKMRRLSMIPVAPGLSGHIPSDSSAPSPIPVGMNYALGMNMGHMGGVLGGAGHFRSVPMVPAPTIFGRPNMPTIISPGAPATAAAGTAASAPGGSAAPGAGKPATGSAAIGRYAPMAVPGSALQATMHTAHGSTAGGLSGMLMSYPYGPSAVGGRIANSMSPDPLFFSPAGGGRPSMGGPGFLPSMATGVMPTVVYPVLSHAILPPVQATMLSAAHSNARDGNVSSAAAMPTFDAESKERILAAASERVRPSVHPSMDAPFPRSADASPAAVSSVSKQTGSNEHYPAPAPLHAVYTTPATKGHARHVTHASAMDVDDARTESTIVFSEGTTNAADAAVSPSAVSAPTALSTMN
jgi:hypothetical protein